MREQVPTMSFCSLFRALPTDLSQNILAHVREDMWFDIHRELLALVFVREIRKTRLVYFTRLSLRAKRARSLRLELELAMKHMFLTRVSDRVFHQAVYMAVLFSRTDIVACLRLPVYRSQSIMLLTETDVGCLSADRASHKPRVWTLHVFPGMTTLFDALLHPRNEAIAERFVSMTCIGILFLETGEEIFLR